ncbi:unnamed protein product [Didymodactylos carnosus]|uniref:Uncharacterized protein n=1 Tax=Didymodactylos carnosus TaxID=1234261 RepID=A0A815UWR4_9BILA|nr:unnamed protein product [Didymodactylos carnosus]CAF1521674.1 unnamed protein product [Didymodactylos carnosus]CAF3803575.1 unnamed protein product [Didymodactylos carnosus]CAF4380879.1 unnamed protein product [Didymodactylos carnosus]
MADSRPGGEKDAYSQQRRLSGSARPPPCSHPSQETPQKEPHRLPARQRQDPCRASSDRIDRREGLGSAPTPAILSTEAPSDYHVNRSLKNWMVNKVYEDLDEVVEDVKEWIASKNRDFFIRRIDMLPSKWEAVIEVDGEYAPE